MAFERTELSGVAPVVRSTVDIYAMNTGGTRSRKVHSCGTGSSGCDVSDKAWSPDGSKLAMVVNAGSRSEIEILDTVSGKITTLCLGLKCGQGLAGLAWSPLGNQIAFSNEGVSGFFGIGLEPSAIWDSSGIGLREESI